MKWIVDFTKAYDYNIEVEAETITEAEELAQTKFNQLADENHMEELAQGGYWELVSCDKQE